MNRVTVWRAWSVSASRLPCGASEAVELELLGSVEFDGDECSFDEALGDVNPALVSAQWRGDGTDYRVDVDGELVYVAQVVTVDELAAERRAA